MNKEGANRWVGALTFCYYIIVESGQALAFCNVARLTQQGAYGEGFVAYIFFSYLYHMKRLKTIHQAVAGIAHRVLLSMVLIVVGSTGCIMSDHPSHEESTYVNVGEMAPDFTVQLVDGGTRTLSSLRGEVVMLIFFSASCPDCQAQFTELARLIGDSWPEFRMLAISREETLEETIEFRDKYEFPFEVGIDPDKKIYSLYASMYVPRTFLIDRAGKVVALDIEFNPDNLQQIWAQATTLAN